MSAPQTTATSDKESSNVTAWARALKKFEHGIIFTMTAMLMMVVTIGTAELVWLLIKDLSSIRGLLLDSDEMFELFGFFLLILIGVELLSTLKIYTREGAIHMEVVLEVALIALAQKVIVLNTSRASAMYLFGLAALILALAAAWWWARIARRRVQ